jgi:hypothetical protein
MSSPPLVPALWQLPDAFRRRLGNSVGRQRIMMDDGHLLIVAHEVPTANQPTRRGILFWRSPDGEWKASNGEPGKIAINNLLDRYERRLEEFDKLEAAATKADQYLPLLDGLGPLLRSSRNLYEVLQEARKAAEGFEELIDVRNRAYDMSRSVELLHQDARNGMDVAVVRRAEQQAAASERMALASYRLNKMAAIFFPLATLAAIFSTTLTEGWSWSQTEMPFAMFLITGVMLGFILLNFVNRSATR